MRVWPAVPTRLPVAFRPALPSQCLATPGSMVQLDDLTVLTMACKAFFGIRLHALGCRTVRLGGGLPSRRGLSDGPHLTMVGSLRPTACRQRASRPAALLPFTPVASVLNAAVVVSALRNQPIRHFKRSYPDIQSSRLARLGARRRHHTPDGSHVASGIRITRHSGKATPASATV